MWDCVQSLENVNSCSKPTHSSPVYSLRGYMSCLQTVYNLMFIYLLLPKTCASRSVLSVRWCLISRDSMHNIVFVSVP
jgi:hypothetical protein